MNLRFAAVPLFLSAASLVLASPVFGAPPSVGEKAPDFALSDVSGRSVRLSEALASSPVVLVVLRGYPGYQCPYCSRQVQDFIQNEKAFADAGVRVILVYPGPPAELGTHAAEFLKDKNLPSGISLLLDPGYEFTNKYSLRWDAPRETAYPSTFLIDREGVIFFSKVVREHGGRTTAAEILDALPKRKP